MKSDEGLEKLLKSKKYRDISEDAVKRVYEEALSRQASAKLADKAARAKLHQITGAFITPDGIKKAREYLTAFTAGDETALNLALALHASTFERPQAEKLYEKVLSFVGKPRLTLDLACGLNPLVLGRMGLKVWACDISVGAVEIVNEWSGKCGWDVRAHPMDLIQTQPPPGDLALFMKLLPLMERQRRGAAAELLKRTTARFKLVTFPTRTLTGRDVGMQRHYAEWFEPMIGDDIRLLDSFVQDDELCYLLEDLNV
ncbi:MAG: 16S rRNA (guanine(1405)-N(7))-methyltransferase RmtF [Clostridia bacterium]|nr:16S rRNA (guanine(1405)-N(7))-methyltransferase RmtF [Clostridia bacterium]